MQRATIICRIADRLPVDYRTDLQGELDIDVVIQLDGRLGVHLHAHIDILDVDADPAADRR